MIENEAPDLGTGPLTLDTAERWLHWLEDIATLERDLGAATRIVLCSLFAELSLSGVINGNRFIARLANSKPQLQNATQRIALQLLIDDLAEQLHGQGRDDTGSEFRH